MEIELLPFDLAAYLTDDESIAEYLTIAFETNDPREITKAIGVVARVRGGIDALAQQSGIESGTLDRILTDGSETNLTALLKILQGLGVKLSASMVA